MLGAGSGGGLGGVWGGGLGEVWARILSLSG